jgi:hypothetical protein
MLWALAVLLLIGWILGIAGSIAFNGSSTSRFCWQPLRFL